MREHLLATRAPAGGWSLSGLFDFELAMMGDREYEFTAVGVFVSCGDAGFLRRLLTAYGYLEDRLDNTLQRRLLASTLLHRTATCPSTWRRCPRHRNALDALATHWWPVDPS